MEEVKDDVTDDEKRSLVLKLIGHDGHVIEQTLGEESVHDTGVSVHLLITPIKSHCEMWMGHSEKNQSIK